VSPAPLSYVVNAGRTDNNSPAANTPMDWQENGVFFDAYTQVGTPRPVTTDLSWISKRDGTAMTLMFSENLDARDWITVSTSTAANWPFKTTQTNSNLNLTWWQGIVWSVPNTMMVYNPTNILNKGTGVVVTTDDTNARPSSNHPGGFIVTMCDGHSQFMSEDVEYRVYCLLMAPDSNASKLAGANTVVTYPSDWYITGTTLKPLSEPDLNK